MISHIIGHDITTILYPQRLIILKYVVQCHEDVILLYLFCNRKKYILKHLFGLQNLLPEIPSSPLVLQQTIIAY